MSANGNRPADRFRHLGTRSTDQYQAAGICPFCEGWLMPGELHRCPDLDRIRPRRRFAVTLTLRWHELLAIAVVAFAVLYLGAHVLVAAGVPCPTP